MKLGLQIAAILGLIFTLLPSFLFYFEVMSLSAAFKWMTAAMVVWYVAATPLLGFSRK